MSYGYPSDSPSDTDTDADLDAAGSDLTPEQATDLQRFPITLYESLDIEAGGRLAVSNDVTAGATDAVRRSVTESLEEVDCVEHGETWTSYYGADGAKVDVLTGWLDEVRPLLEQSPTKSLSGSRTSTLSCVRSRCRSRFTSVEPGLLDQRSACNVLQNDV